jgi:hypothetical protein
MENKMLTVYCIPGLGINEEVFRNLDLENCDIRYIKWITPLKNERLPEYALRLAEQMDTSQPFALIGMSFGGMCAVEIAKKYKPVKTILVSSSKTCAEIPLNMRMWAQFPLYKNFNDTFYKSAAINIKSLFGVKDKEQGERFERMLNSAPENYFAGAIHCLLTWDNKEVPENLVHIHGTSDLVLPYQKITKCDYTIKDGTHFMIVNRSEEINAIINAELKMGGVSQSSYYKTGAA